MTTAPSNLSRPAPGTASRADGHEQRPNRIDSLSLLSGQRELIIEHAGCEYRLRRTQNDKLILTK
ncbi:MAG: hemin uptake protein HemP [Xanthomonadales bacterium]|nr:hemin uptake protein HemP [Xanthomonadales bacterium]